MEQTKQTIVNTNEIMFPDVIFNNILSYCIDIDTFKGDINKEAAIEQITMKNVKLQPIGLCYMASVVDDIANSNRYKILEKIMFNYTFFKMNTYYIAETITDYKICFGCGDINIDNYKTLTADIQFTYDKSKESYRAILSNIKDVVEIEDEDD